jgi:D-alanine-D-alanine ligase
VSERLRVVILHNAIAADAEAAECDVLVQVDAVAAALRLEEADVVILPVDLDLASTVERLREMQPELVVNLVESLDGSGRLIHLVPALLERMGVAFTGASADAMFLTSNKLIAKRWMTAHGVPTPATITSPPRGAEIAQPRGPDSDSWIIKSVWEDASLGLDDESVVVGRDQARRMISRRRAQYGDQWFAERFVAGREFNVAMLADGSDPVVLPLTEIRFVDFPPGKPWLVGYRAKWQPDSFEYQHTRRDLLRGSSDRELTATLEEMSRRCWNLFGLRGYARVDFRLDHQGQPWVLEVNANPCLSPNAGFAAALEAAEIPFADALHRIMNDAPAARLAQVSGAALPAGELS